MTFEIVVQPILVSIDPMFADQPATSISGRFAPDTPAEWASLATVIVGIIIYTVLAKPYIKNKI